MTRRFCTVAYKVQIKRFIKSPVSYKSTVQRKNSETNVQLLLPNSFKKDFYYSCKLKNIKIVHLQTSEPPGYVGAKTEYTTPTGSGGAREINITARPIFGNLQIYIKKFHLWINTSLCPCHISSKQPGFV